MKAGELNKRCRFEHQDRQADETGQLITTWQTLGTRWAKVRPLRGSEAIESMGQSVDQVAYTLIVRADELTSSLKADMRAIVEGRTLSITSIRNVELSNRFLEITAIERP